MISSTASRLTADSSVIMVGAGGHARSVLGVLQDIGCGIVGLVADVARLDQMLAGIEVLGELNVIPEIHSRYPGAVWVMAIGDNYHRLRIMQAICLEVPGVIFPAVMHPSAIVSGDVEIEPGAVIMPGAVVLAGCRLGVCSLINTRASLDHESTLGEGASLAPGVVTGGRATIGRRAFVGIGAMVVQGIQIGADTVVGAGSLLLHDLPEKSVAYGQPARVIRQRAVDEPYF